MLVDPERITPDGNGVYDKALLRARVRVDRPPATCRPATGAWLLDTELILPVEATRRGRTAQQRVVFREAALLDPSEAGASGWEVPFAFAWDGRDAAGAPVKGPAAVGARWSATVVRLDETSGRRRTVGQAHADGPPVEVSPNREPSERAWEEARAALANIGSDPDAPEGDSPHGFHLAPPEAIEDFARLLAIAGGIDLEQSFAAQAAEVDADPGLTVRPSDEQVAAWHRLYVGSAGRVLVRWSEAGTPLLVDGLDAGILSGEPAEVAAAWLARFETDLRTLYRMGPDEQFVPGEVVPAPDGSYAGVFVRHGVKVSTDLPASFARWDVVGDHLIVRVRLAGMPKQSGRVGAVTSAWHPVAAPPAVAVDAERARSIALGAANLPAPYVIATDGPVLLFPRPDRAQVQYRVVVGDAGRPYSKLVVVDAETGAVAYVEDATRTARSRVRSAFSPATDAEILSRDFTGLPYAYVALPMDDGRTLLTTTDRLGCYDPSGPSGLLPRGEVFLAGPYYREHTMEMHEPAYQWHTRLVGDIPDTSVTTTLGLGPLSRARAMNRDDRVFIDATIYMHMNYQADLLRLAGLVPPRGWQPAKFQVDRWGPLGELQCNPANGFQDCDGCRGGLTPPARAGNCNADAYWDFGGDNDDCKPAAYFPPGDADNDVPGCPERSVIPPINGEFPDAWHRVLCNPTYAMPGAPAGTGVCDWADYGPPSIDLASGCFDFTTRSSPGGPDCINIHMPAFTCTEPTGCPMGRGVPGGTTDYFRVALAAATGALGYDVPHENMHHILGMIDFFRGASQAGGLLAGFVSEALPDSAGTFYYPQTLLWNNRWGDLMLWHLDDRFWFGGDPVTGGGCAGGAETDDPRDGFVCPVGGSSPTCEMSMCYEPCPAGACDCPAAAAPGTVVCQPDGSRWRPIGVHGNGGWLDSALTRYVVMMGRDGALPGFAGLLNAGMDGATRATVGPNSVYEKLALGHGSPYLLPGLTKTEAWRAFAYSARGAARPAPMRGDTDSDLTFRGDPMPPSRPFAFGKQVAGGSLSSGVSDTDQQTAYLYEGRTYGVSLWDFDDAGLSLTVRVEPAAPGGPPPPAVPPVIGMTTGFLGEATFAPVRTGWYSFGVQRVGRDMSVEAEWALVLSMNEDYPDRTEDAIHIPARGQVRGEMLGGEFPPRDIDSFRFFLEEGRTQAVRVWLLDGTEHPDVFLDGEVCPWATVGAGERCMMAVGPAPPGGAWYGILVTQGTAGATEPVSAYLLDLRLPSGIVESPAPSLPCAAATPPGTAPVEAVCRLNDVAAGLRPGPVFSGVHVSDADVDNLWLEVRRGQVYGLRYDGQGRVRIYHATAMGRDRPPPLAPLQPGTNVNPIFRTLDVPLTAFAGVPISFVAPRDGYWRIEIVPPGGGGEFAPTFPQDYTLQVFGGIPGWERFPDIAAMFEGACLEGMPASGVGATP